MQLLNSKRMKLVVVGIVAVILVCGGTAKADFIFGQLTNAALPLSNESVYHVNCFSSDGLEIYLNSTGGDTSDLWVIRRETIDDDWGTPVNLGPQVNGPDRDQSASISSDGLELYFTSMRPDGYGLHDIWVTRRVTKNADWGIPENLGPMVNSSENEGTPQITKDGLELYFYSRRPGGFGREDIYVATRATTDDPWNEPVNLGAVVNSSTIDVSPAISPDGLALFFGSKRPGGYGQEDLWMTTRTTVSDAWGAPVNLGAMINSPPNGQPNQKGPTLSIDGLTLYFVSTGPFGLGQVTYQIPIIPIVDLNSDGIVDAADMVIMVDNWGTDNSLCDIGPMPWGDGIVNVQDLVVLAEHLFEVIPPMN
jgi:hypothetical protein